MATFIIDVITLFPEMLEGFLSTSILGRAINCGLLEVNVHNLRNWAEPPHYIVDDRPFGGGAGMLIKPEPLGKAIEALKKENSTILYLCPDGSPLNTQKAQGLAKQQHLILISGHYEGIDERIRSTYVDMEISIGDYVLTNGTLPAAVLIDATCRFIPGVLGSSDSLGQDSFSDNRLAPPQYTRPALFAGQKVPEVLLSGNHQAIETWRQEQRTQKTKVRRPDLALQ